MSCYIVNGSFWLQGSPGSYCSLFREEKRHSYKIWQKWSEGRGWKHGDQLEVLTSGKRWWGLDQGGRMGR